MLGERRFYSNSRVNSGLSTETDSCLSMIATLVFQRLARGLGNHACLRRKKHRDKKMTHTHDTPFPGQKESSLRGGTLETSSDFSFFPHSLPGHFYDRHSRSRRYLPGHPLSRVRATWRMLESPPGGRGRIANMASHDVRGKGKLDIIFPTLTHYAFYIYIYLK